ncbi:MAG: hypothetical protein M3462_07270 [Chloroflexota bacterium]|nr:hypothetical protein [Chloroflexota bacterium]
MPRIYDNLTEDARLVGALRSALDGAVRADVCVGYFNLRGWQALGAAVDALPPSDGAKPPCRVLVGMQRPPEDELRSHLVIRPEGDAGVPLIDNASATRLKRQMAEEFRRQLTIGAPTDRDEAALRRLSRQLREGRVRV